MIQWHGILAYEDVETADGRRIGTDAIHWPLPDRVLPLRALQAADPLARRFETRVVGTIDRIFRVGGEIRGEGTLADEGVLDVVAELSEGPIPGGVDLDNVLVEAIGEVWLVKYADIAAFTLYLAGSGTPAFTEGTWIAEGLWEE